ncbi:MAG: peptidoglycan DD-metalloendopeptidase family protein [Thermodesulfobacteriota bacterium]
MLRPAAVAIACLVLLLPALFLSGAASAAGESAELRRERSRLMEMKAREEKTAAELSEALRKEKLTKERVTVLQKRLNRQRELLAGIDRRLSALERRQDETEREVREISEAQGRTRSGIRRAARIAFERRRAEPAGPPVRPASERERYLMRGFLGADLEDFERLSQARERKERELSGIERQVEISERKMDREKKVGDSLLSRAETERKRLAGIEREKQAKQRELRALRARIARMESLVSRIERLAKERERLARKKAERKAGREAAPRPPAEPPRRFASLAGGLSSPMPGRIVTRFGKQHDPTFDVTIENRGVELEGASGALVKASAAGEVAFSGAVSGFGNVLILQHGSGLFSVYGKLDAFLARTGQEVAKGQVVGRLPESPTGKSVLYFELRAGGTAIDPASVISLDR